MAFNFANLKARVRKVVHDTLSVSALYEDSTLNFPVPIKARLHTKVIVQGDMDYAGYAEVIEGIERVVFAVSDANRLGVKRGGIISFPDYATVTGVPSFLLDSREPNTGPFEEVWRVTRQ